ncbi:Beta-site APP-cleaving enzyme [Phlyctochytrium planicorne]|nr:Beta-site APP-cleaving enzyme [Phlyctochytrium planicorne]
MNPTIKSVLPSRLAITTLTFLCLVSSITAIQIPLRHPVLGTFTGSNDAITPQSSSLEDDADVPETQLKIVQSKRLQGLGGGPTMTGCWLGNMTVGGTAFAVLIDSGSSDLLIPGTDINNYEGPTYNTAGKTRLSNTVYRGLFGDNSSWSGYFYQDTVNINGDSVTAPFAVMDQQSVQVLVTDGVLSQGLLGIGYDLLAVYQRTFPNTVFTSLYTEKVIQRNMIAFRGCPAWSSQTSMLDWGAENLNVFQCPGAVAAPNATLYEGTAIAAWAKNPVQKSAYYTVNVVGVSMDGVAVNLGRDWQANGDYSFVDSCSTSLLVPDSVYQFLTGIVSQNKALLGLLSAKQVQQLVFGGYGYKLVSYFPYLFASLVVNGDKQGSKFPYDSLPTLNVTLESSIPGEYINLALSSRTYFQSDAEGYIFFLVQNVGRMTHMVLGAVVFDSFLVVMDREKNRIGFGPGCECLK